MSDLIPMERIENKILLIRGQKVLLDRDLAELYGVETKNLKRQVRRNIDRFPADFMFLLNHKELTNLRCQFGTSSWGGIRIPPYAFTEQGIAMLSSILNSKPAIRANIAIMRAFVKMREMVLSNAEFAKKLTELEERLDKHDENTLVIMATLRKLISKPKEPTKKKIGFP